MKVTQATQLKNRCNNFINSLKTCRKLSYQKNLSEAFSIYPNENKRDSRPETRRQLLARATSVNFTPCTMHHVLNQSHNCPQRLGGRKIKNRQVLVHSYFIMKICTPHQQQNPKGLRSATRIRSAHSVALTHR